VQKGRSVKLQTQVMGCARPRVNPQSSPLDGLQSKLAGERQQGQTLKVLCQTLCSHASPKEGFGRLDPGGSEDQIDAQLVLPQNCWQSAGRNTSLFKFSVNIKLAQCKPTLPSNFSTKLMADRLNPQLPSLLEESISLANTPTTTKALFSPQPSASESPSPSDQMAPTLANLSPPLLDQHNLSPST